MTSLIEIERMMEAGEGRPAPPAVVALYLEAFHAYGPLMLWSSRQVEEPTIAQALAVAEALRTEGNMRSRPLAVRIEEACRAAL